MPCRWLPEQAVRLVALLLVLTATVMPAAWARPKTLLPFELDTWPALTRSPAAPTVVVFSTTDCVYCPGVIDRIAAAIHATGSGAKLLVVVMDGAQHGDSVLADPNYAKADALYAFDIHEAGLLRYRVNPDWNGITPYVALLVPGAPPRFFAGAPPDAALRAFLKR